MSNLRKRLATRVEPSRAEVTDTYPTGRQVPVLDDEGKPKLDVHKQPKMQPEEVTATYVLIGMPDDYTLTIGLMGDQEQARQAAMYNAHLRDRWKDNPVGMPQPFTKEDVYKIRLVAHYLQPEYQEEEGPDGYILVKDGKPVQKLDANGQPIKSEPLSEYDIANLSKENGPLFTRMFVEAIKMANNKTGARTGDVEIEDPVVTVGMGNSEPAATGN